MTISLRERSIGEAGRKVRTAHADAWAAELASVIAELQYKPPSLKFTFSALWRVVVILSLVWAVGGSLDGADLQELIAVPLVMAAWAFGIFILDRWVVKA
jgi:hypothetical protein